jgi:putative ABC transport system permease protein
MTLLRLERVVRMSVKNIAQYKARALLTILGIVFGVCSVVAMLSVGEGASREAQAKFLSLGATNILIKSVKLPDDQGGTTTSGNSNSSMLKYGLSYDDAEHISGRVPHLKSVTSLKRLRLNVCYRDKKMETQLVATMPWYADVSNHRVLAGRFISQSDGDVGAAVCVIGAHVANTLFAAADPLDKMVRIDKDVYRVVGVVGDPYSKPGFTNKPLWFVGENEEVYVPLNSYLKRNGDMIVKFSQTGNSFEKVELHELVLTVDDQADVMASADAVRQVLTAAHTRPDYDIVVPLQLIQNAKETQRLMNIVLGSIAAISLIVGGIGIMNIMLATVSERTREIGIRRALGAHRNDIVQQFLIETLVLSITGGIIGMILGAVIPIGISFFTKVSAVLTPGSFIVAFSVSVAVGLVFGIYPARRAAQMDPIEALRHE